MEREGNQINLVKGFHQCQVLYLFQQFLLSVTKEHECKMVVAAMDGPIQEEADHPTESSVHHCLGVNVFWAGEGGGGGVRL